MRRNAAQVEAGQRLVIAAVIGVHRADGLVIGADALAHDRQRSGLVVLCEIPERDQQVRLVGPA
jgi:hypothetical protein